MAARYPSQTFEVYDHSQWPAESKPAFTDSDASSVLDDKVLDPSTPVDLLVHPDHRRLSLVKAEEDYSTSDNMWQERPHATMAPQMRHYSMPTVPQLNTHQPYLQSYAVYPQAWPMSANSGTNTPTPVSAQIPHGYGFGQSPAMPYSGGPVGYPHIQHPHDPASAISMSPQSSQGGWASGTSSDDTVEPHSSTIHSPRFRGSSPTSILCPDGIRKKNARFEIPKERNLQNIDSMIMASTDESEKKELKQQKRLLRNRQAALDSRQRKKTHTEKLEQEKKVFNQQKTDMEEALQAAHESIQVDRERWLQQTQQYEQYIRQVEFERDEAIRTKTLETTELRRMNNILKETVRDLERQSAVRHFDLPSGSAMSHHDTYTPDFSSFDNLGIDDCWDDDFSIITNGHEDMKMESIDSMHQSSTPRPAQASHTSSSTSIMKVSDSKSEVSFWNTFYMCLLFGAFVATNSSSASIANVGTKSTTASTSTSATASAINTAIPSLSEDYRAEAGNVLKAVLASGPDGISNAHAHLHAPAPSLSSAASALDTAQLHAHLTTPTRHQQHLSAFSLNAASYNHMTNPDPQAYLGDEDEEMQEIKPSRLESALASMQERREASGVDEILRRSAGGSGNNVGGMLWERVPEKVLRDFREMVERAGGLNV